MVSCQEPSPLKGSKHSLQLHPHDAALVNAHSFVFMGVEARCCPCHSTAHRRHMKRQPSLHHCCPRCGHCHCNCRRRLHRRPHCQVHCRCRHRHHRRHRCCRPLPSRLPLPIAATVSVASPSAIDITLAVGHCRLHHHRPLQLPSPSAITVAVAIGHCQE